MKNLSLIFCFILSINVFSQTESFEFQHIKLKGLFQVENKFKSFGLVEESNESLPKLNTTTTHFMLKNETSSFPFDAKQHQFKLKFPEKRLNYNELMISCGTMQPTSSHDLMIDAVKYYVLNKYVFSLFSNTEYD